MWKFSIWFKNKPVWETEYFKEEVCKTNKKSLLYLSLALVNVFKQNLTNTVI